MTKKEFEKIGKAVLPELPGFAVKGQLLFAQPVGHTLRGFFFARSIGSREFYVQVFVQPLFVPAKHIGFNFGWRLGGGSHFWHADAAGLINELNMGIKREALPFLSLIKSPLDVAEAGAALQRSADPIVQQAIAYSFARGGEVGQACKTLDQFVRLVRPTGFWLEEIDRAEALKTQLLTKPASAQGQLEIWENESAANLGLEEFR
jgi:hypothetical protein